MAENLCSQYLPCERPVCFYTLLDNSGLLVSSSHPFHLSPLDINDGRASSRSSVWSVILLAMTLQEEEDEDTRALPQLILHKIRDSPCMTKWTG